MALSLAGVQGEIVVRVTDAVRTNEVVLRLQASKEMSLTLPMAPHSLAYIGTDLPDPIANYSA